MAQMFNTLQASLAIMMPQSLANLMESYASILRIQALLLFGMILCSNFLFESSCDVFDKSLLGVYFGVVLFVD